jgi:hypothetical protein
VAQEAMWVTDVVRQLARAEIRDVVRTRRALQPSEASHPECNGVIGACSAAADSEPAQATVRRDVSLMLNFYTSS